MPKSKKITPKEFAQLVKTARELGVLTIEVDGFKATLSPPQPNVIKFDPSMIPEELRLPTPDQLNTETRAMALKNMEQLGFIPRAKIKKPENLTEAITLIQEKQQDDFDHGLFMDREDFGKTY